MILRIPLLLLLCLCLNVLAPECIAIPDDREDCWIVLEGNNSVKMPSVSLSSQEAKWTYPFPLFPIYSLNESISGEVLGPDRLAGTEIDVCISNFSIFDILSSREALNNDTKILNCSIRTRLNDTGDSRFFLNNQTGGLYTIRAVDRENSTAIATNLVLIANGEIAVDLPSNVTAGDLLPLKIEAPSAGGSNSSIYYGAIMISSQDYSTANISLFASDTAENVSSTISLSNNSMQVEGLPGISIEFIMNLLNLLPQNSGIAMQELREHTVELYIITEPNLAKGEYILTCAAYSSDRGLIGLRQKTIEVI